MTAVTKFHQQKRFIDLHSREFREIFGTELKNFYGKNVIEIMMGFDIVKFDDYIKPPDNVSLSDFLKEKFGERAQSLIKSLL